MSFKPNRWKKAVTLLIVLSLFLGLSIFLLPEIVNADAGLITVKVDGEICKTFTLEELEGLQKEKYYTYSTINTWPTKSWYIGEGPTLADLLTNVEMPEGLRLEDIQMIRFKAADGLQLSFTKKELLEDTRYYFPGLKENHEYFGHVSGSSEGAFEVPTVLALLSIDSDDPADLEGRDRNAPHLLFGQRWITEQTNQAFVKTVSEIDLLTTAPEKWDIPTATPEQGMVSPGTKVRLSCRNNDTDKVYYTVDGSDPTYKSSMYNLIASRWWNNRKDDLDEINKPIEINGDTVIKAVTIGLSKENSDIVTFIYKVAEEFILPERIILTWTDDPTTTQTVTWLMPPDSSAAIQYLQAKDYSGNFDAARHLGVPGTAFNTGGTLYRYTANIAGLSPDTEYVYRVGSKDCWSEPAVFTTATEDKNFTFLYMGDIQADYALWGNMLDSVYETYPEIKFALLGGDLTDNSYDEDEWGEFLDAAGVFSRIPVMPTLGNHDGLMYLKFFALPENGPEGLKQEFYSFDYGDAHFVILNSNNNTNVAAKQWLQQDLEASNKKWKFVAFHHPIYPVVYDYKGIDRSIYENWVPILEQNEVDMVFVGHQHVYMRTHPIFQDEVQSDSYGIVYVMGNAGSKIYAADEDFSYIANERTGSNYQVIDLDGDVLTLTSKEANGETIEIYMIDKSIQTRPEKPKYNVVPKADPVYGIGVTTDGIKTMTVNSNQAGFKYFTVLVEPLIAHEGTETAVFTQLRDGVQLQLNSLTADFDLTGTAQAGFNVEDGDIIKVYLVDSLNNATDFNPTILQ